MVEQSRETEMRRIPLAISSVSCFPNWSNFGARFVLSRLQIWILPPKKLKQTKCRGCGE